MYWTACPWGSKDFFCSQPQEITRRHKTVLALVSQVEQGTLRIPDILFAHCIAIANQNNLKIVVTYFKSVIRTTPQPPPALGCKIWWKSRMSLPSHNFPLLSLDARGSLRISTPQLTRIFPKLFSLVVLRPLALLGCCTKLSLLSKQYLNNKNKKHPRQENLDQEFLRSYAIFLCWHPERNVYSFWWITFCLLHNPLDSFLTIPWSVILHTEYTLESISYREQKH